jgi:hypothetical protein
MTRAPEVSLIAPSVSILYRVIVSEARQSIFLNLNNV